MEQSEAQFELSIVMPCLNEAETVGLCVIKAQKFLSNNNIHGEVIVADNGSTDGSIEIAEKAGARIVSVKKKGYGSALIGGITAANGEFIIIGDADDSYDFLNLMPILQKLRDGYTLVVGNRFAKDINPMAMSWLHKHIGNPLLSGIGRLFFKININDFHCGLRGFTKEAFEKMDLQTTGMEFASEMIVKATIFEQKITQVPITLYPAGRTGRSHLRSFRDGIRHLYFLLIYSPRWFFLYPGLLMMAIGFLVAVPILFQPHSKWSIHTILYASGALMIGFQLVIFAILSKTFAVHEKLLPTNPKIEKILSKISPNKGMVLGFIMVIIGLAGSIYTLIIWEEGAFFKYGVSITMRIVIASFTMLVLGFQLIFSSFFFNMLKVNTK